MDRESFDRDRALVEAMRLVGEPIDVIEDFLLCLDLDDTERAELLAVARHGRAADIADGDVISMNPLTSMPQRARSRD